MRRLTSLVLITLLLTISSCNYLKQKGWFGIGKKERELAMLKARQDSIRVVDSLRKIENRIKALEQARLDSIRLAEEEKESWEHRYRYNIIVGSFLTPEFARDWAEEYLRMGFADTRIFRPEGSDFELVAVEAHENYIRALSRLEQYRDTVNIDSWLYIYR